MNQPFAYYGGKQTMIDELIMRMPSHKTYVEPFVGGGSLFWAKGPSPVEVLNDKNQMLANFYMICGSQFDELRVKIQNTIHCEATYKRARNIYRHPKGYTRLDRAWSVWVGANMTFGSSLFSGTWKFQTNSQDVAHIGNVIANKRRDFTSKYRDRLDRVIIFNRDALDVANRYNHPDTFMYLDPPYVGANMGHYKGYKEDDFVALLDILATTRSKFLLSSYNHPKLAEYSAKYGWNTDTFSKHISVSTHTSKNKKIEVLTYNYNNQLTLFS